MKFAKYHGCGNNFIITEEEEARAGLEMPGAAESASAPGESAASAEVSAAEHERAESELPDNCFGRLAQRVCDPNTGIGADGLIVVRRAPELEMIFFNRDGSRAPMCGNGIRCFANYCYDTGLRRETGYPVRTQAGIMQVRVVRADAAAFIAEIGMGRPDFAPGSFGVAAADFEAGPAAGGLFQRTLDTSAGPVTVYSCFMGTVHTAVFLGAAGSGSFQAADICQFSDFDLETLGAELSDHPLFTEKTNVNFIRCIDPNTLEVRTYERGAGVTLACGTGACASVVIGAILGKCESEADVLLPLGTLHITQDAGGFVRMAGPAKKIAYGEYLGG